MLRNQKPQEITEVLDPSQSMSKLCNAAVWGQVAPLGIVPI
jgi:hypothetical protein